ncbi:MAG: glutathione S-transferase N-terminal domain-containing protein [Betaproteobacteria bacterium]|nr:glutathione S-transferase N-terminal domain-containing protein [Betaproteobacteria bacterium]MBI2959147.1 glutathione S-transferase N-terminal domain-containing protein [Betaproteobacteria bacterium]
MKIVGTQTSPFVRKVRVFAIEKNINVDYVVDRPSSPGSRVAEFNPLGKIPVLVLDDGEVVFDSVVIVDYLEGVKPEPQLIPTEFRGRIAVRRWEALADGIVDAVVNISHQYGPMNDAEKHAAWIPNQEAKIERGLSLIERTIAGREWLHGAGFTLADIAAGYALAYVDYALPRFERRRRFPGLSAYSERLMTRPSFRTTVPSAS